MACLTFVRAWSARRPSASSLKPGDSSSSPEDDSDPRHLPPAGSVEEYAEAAQTVGFPGAFDVNNAAIERAIRCHLFWES